MDGLKEFMRHKETVAFTMASGFITGAFLVYLSASQHIFEDLYGLKDSFPYIFAGLSISIGLSTFSNGTLVLRYGMWKLSYMALLAFCAVAIVFVVLYWQTGNPSVIVLITFLSLQFFCLGFMWGNFRSIAMQPIGHIAGIGAAINGFISTVISIPIATFIGSYVEDEVLPLFIGLAVCGLISVFIFWTVRRPKGMVTAK